ncbi:hypothetical protein AS034_16065 [[Bacillus] enclensis]|uniref:3-dehydroquinate synthase n=1 Tax=[Bacillus] enclensis TaxID=1402860 RepID=A0A0V8HD15_9BACI|nr:sedoheptulose 7-phosphate cyclase [[Bacillus] enclensis]KSU60357.1 hypothetical protein AS034_16065 [[Bacillus] enclensis]SCC23587.1 3-dehydroquinate synthase [[Bacillus] enclensis]
MSVSSNFLAFEQFAGLTTNLKVEYHITETSDVFNVNNLTIQQNCKSKKLLIVTSPTVYRLYGHQITEYLSYHFSEDSYKIIVIETTEENKDFDNVMKICEAGKNFGLDRRSLLVAIGGGILMDMVGFAASMYKRKIDYIRIPTTLVGQIDAGVGVKTGVNFKGSKNFIGAFHPPYSVINDTSLLYTLEKDELICGLAEIIKMGIIVDAQLFELVNTYGFSLVDSNFQGNLEAANSINQKAVQRMLEQLESNLFELFLERLVDFGHTFSPFIEEFSNYQIKHGIAVGYDMAISTEISYLLNRISKKDRDKILTTLMKIGINIYHKETFIAEKMWNSLNNIVLHRGNKLNLVIPTGIGQSDFLRELTNLSPELLHQAIENLAAYQYSYTEGILT